MYNVFRLLYHLCYLLWCYTFARYFRSHIYSLQDRVDGIFVDGMSFLRISNCKGRHAIIIVYEIVVLSHANL